MKVLISEAHIHRNIRKKKKKKKGAVSKVYRKQRSIEGDFDQLLAVQCIRLIPLKIQL